MKSIKSLYKIGYGPSSSHTMGPEIAAQLLKKHFPQAESYRVSLYGSLALTGKGHLTDYIIEKTLAPKKVEFRWLAHKQLPKHSNAMVVEVFGIDENQLGKWTIYSVGGGELIIDELQANQADNDVYPQKSFNEIAEVCELKNWSLVDYVNYYEQDDIDQYLFKVWDIMKNSIAQGLKNEGLIPGKLKVKRKAKQIYNSSDQLETKLISYAYAVNEENAAASSLIVTSPTCGAAGTLPALLKYNQEKLNLSDQKIIDALKVASVFGNLIRTNASISGAEAGCQAEVGTATSMAAAADAFLHDANLIIVESAAEIGMEHQLGLTCDPIGGYVQIPCIQRNAIATSKAKEASALARVVGHDEHIDFDTIVQVMYETGKDLPYAYRETSKGGLAKHFKQSKIIKK